MHNISLQNWVPFLLLFYCEAYILDIAPGYTYKTFKKNHFLVLEKYLIIPTENEIRRKMRF